MEEMQMTQERNQHRVVPKQSVREQFVGQNNSRYLPGESVVSEKVPRFGRTHQSLARFRGSESHIGKAELGRPSERRANPGGPIKDDSKSVASGRKDAPLLKNPEKRKTNQTTSSGLIENLNAVLLKMEPKRFK